MSSDPSAQKLIILVDSSWLLRRWFQTAPAQLGRTKDGHHVEVAAVNGYLQTMAKRFYGRYSKVEFDQIIHVLDSDGSDYRRGLYPAYKAGRPPKDPALAAQEAMLPRALTALGEAIAQRRGVEADDLIATLARQFADQGHQVAVYTGDKDLFQLVEDGRILIIREQKNAQGFNDLDFFDEARVKEKMNVNADQIAAYLALMGDAIDNIKGVKGVGEKKAAALLNEHGSLAGILTQADAIKGALGQAIRDARDSGSLELDYKLTLALDKVEGISHEDYAQPVIVETTLATQWHQTLGMLGHPLRLSDHRVAHEQTVPRSELKPDAPTAQPASPAVSQGRPTARFGSSRPTPPASAATPVAAAPTGGSLDALVEDNPFEDAFTGVQPTHTPAPVTTPSADLDLPFDLDEPTAPTIATPVAETSSASVEPVSAPVAPVRPVEPAPAYEEAPPLDDDAFMGGFDDGFALTDLPEFAKGAPLKSAEVDATVEADTDVPVTPAAPVPTADVDEAVPAPGARVTDVFPPEGSMGTPAETVVQTRVVVETVTVETVVTPARPRSRFSR